MVDLYLEGRADFHRIKDSGEALYIVGNLTNVHLLHFAATISITFTLDVAVFGGFRLIDLRVVLIQNELLGVSEERRGSGHLSGLESVWYVFAGFDGLVFGDFID